MCKLAFNITKAAPEKTLPPGYSHSYIGFIHHLMLNWTFFKYNFFHHLIFHGGDHAKIQNLIIAYDILKFEVCQTLNIFVNVTYYFSMSF
jgi:hypothetical protein